MGADIHVFVEQYRSHSWRKVVEVDWAELGVVCDDDADDDEPWPIYFGMGRNRGFWAILNEFWGNRGLPSDVSETIRTRWEKEDCAGGASWVMLQELIDFPWNRVTPYNGLVDGANFQRHQSGKPFSCYRQWSANEKPVTMPIQGRKIVSCQEMEERIASGNVPPNYYTLIAFSTSYGEYGDLLYRYTIPRLSLLGAPHHVRVVFWFDY